MNLDFADYTITIAIVPVDLRAGYSRLSAIALTLMKIDVDQGNDVVIFISKRRHMCKVLWSDCVKLPEWNRISLKLERFKLALPPGSITWVGLASASGGA